MEKVKVHDKEFEIFINQMEIEKRIKLMAEKMNKDLAGKNPIFLGILNGSFMFASELFKSLEIDCSISFLKLASYQGTSSSGSIKQLIGLNENLSERTVVIIEDIIDTGITMENIVKQLKGFEPERILISTLLYKPNAYNNCYPIDYYCFDIPNDFIVGYGLDYNGYGRNLKHIYKIINDK
ncbi:MAG: hypoxanthine phosphoribosyltransferase [Bacteroidales bacterium]|nr:hypoxanthine phosphoribosyltransferase [Bacteroidales bacterium]